MKNLQDMGRVPRPLVDSNQSDSVGLLKTGIFSFLLHIFLISFLILNLKTGTTKRYLPVYRVTIKPLSSQHKSNPHPLQALPISQPILPKTQIQKEKNRPKEEVKQSKPIEEPKQLPQHQVDDQTIQKPIPLPMAETPTSYTDPNLEKEQILPIPTPLPSEEKNTSTELSAGVGVGTGTGTGGSSLRSSGEGEGTGTGRWGSGWGGSGEGSGRGKGGSGLRGSGKGTGTGRGGQRGGSGGGGLGAASPRYGENPKPPYPQEARNKGHQGKVLLKVEVLPDGWVGEIEVKESSGYKVLDQSALETVKKWRFIPASKGGAAIPCWVHIPINFQLRDISF
jgi:TonB family protein